MSTVNTNGAFNTSDTSLATYLIAEGFILSNIDYSQTRYVFTFLGDSDKLKDHENKYIVGKAKVDPATYSRINRNLLRSIRNQSQWRED